MNVDYLKINKKLSVIDEVVVNFAKNTDLKNVIYGKYITILFGKNNWTDKIHVLSEKITFDKFAKFFNTLSKNSFHFKKEKEDLFEDLINKKTIKIYWKELPIPYITFSFTHTELERLTLKTFIIVFLDNIKLNIRTPEIEIPSLIKNKNMEDAVFLYKLFLDKLDMKFLKIMCKIFNVAQPL